MKWVYILQCEDNYFYVGETTRLYRRFWEHQNGKGGVNTSCLKPENIVAIYKVDTIVKFMDYNDYVNKIIDGIWNEKYTDFKLRDFDEPFEYYGDNLEAENNIAECLMIHKKETWDKIKGGKYTRFDIDYKYPENEYIKQLPLCKCGLPCDIKKADNYLFFRCAKKNIWGKMKEEFGIDDPCNFYMEYIKDKPFRNINKTFEDRKIVLKELLKKSSWLEKVEIGDSCIECGSTTKTKISYSNRIRNLCFDCFIDKNEELSKRYKSKCLM